MPEGGEEIAKSLETCVNPPKVIDLSFNYMNNNTAKLLTDSASRNSKIQKTFIEFNSIKLRYIEELQKKCK